MRNGATFWFTPIPTLSQEIPTSAVNLYRDGCLRKRVGRPPDHSLCPVCGQIGNVGIYSYRGPHAFYDDMAMSKTFTITERVKAQFRFDGL